MRRTNAATIAEPSWYGVALSGGCNKSLDTGGEVVTYTRHDIAFTATSPPYSLTTVVETGIEKDWNGNVKTTVSDSRTAEGFGLTLADKITNAATYPNPFSSPTEAGESMSSNTGGPTVSYRFTTITSDLETPYIRETSTQNTYEINEDGANVHTEVTTTTTRGLGETPSERAINAAGGHIPAQEATQAGETSYNTTGGESCTAFFSKKTLVGGTTYALTKNGSASVDTNGICSANGSVSIQGYGTTPQERMQNSQGAASQGDAESAANESANGLSFEGSLDVVGTSYSENNVAGSVSYGVTLSNAKAATDSLTTTSYGETIDGGTEVKAVIPTLEGYVIQDMEIKTPIRTTKFASAQAKWGYESSEAANFVLGKIDAQGDSIEYSFSEDVGNRSATGSSTTIVIE